MSGDRTLIVIPARGGSRRIPRKNLAPCAGRPLMCWTIEAAMMSGCRDIMVSTEDKEISEVAYVWGAHILPRPSELAQDSTPGMDVVIHAAAVAKDKGFSHLVYLQPTSPLRIAADVKNGLALMGNDPVVGISERRESLHAALVGVSIRTWGHHGNLQDAPAPFVVCGAFYGARVDWLLEHKTWYSDMTRGLYVPQERALDVDTPWDLRIADAVLGGRV